MCAAWLIDDEIDADIDDELESAMSTACSASPVSALTLPGRAAAVPAAVRRDAWQLAPGQAITLRAREAHVLRVRQGRLWVTLDATARWGSEDQVIGPGEELRVPAGQRLVMEPWDGCGATWSWERG